MAQHDNAVGYAANLIKIVTDNNHRATLLAKAINDVENPLLFANSKGSCRLVEERDAFAPYYGPSYRNCLALTARKLRAGHCDRGQSHVEGCDGLGTTALHCLAIQPAQMAAPPGDTLLAAQEDVVSYIQVKGERQILIDGLDAKPPTVKRGGVGVHLGTNPDLSRCGS
jgi:hypothetical protein